MTPHLTEGIAEAEKIVRACKSNTLVLPEGIISAEAEGDMSGWGLNLAALPRETLYQLEEGITAELRTREGHTLQSLSEQKDKLEQLSLQCNNMVAQNQRLE